MRGAADIVGVPLFDGEAMLLRWLDSSSAGKTVTFQLDIDSAPGVHPFRGLGTGKYGQKFRLVAVPITDSGQPQSSPGSPMGAGSGSPASAAPPPPPKPQGDSGEAKRERTLAEKVAWRCKDERFQTWVSHQTGGFEIGGGSAEEQTVSYVREFCGVTTRAQILPGTDPGRKWGILE
ncbi:MAG TPA: hypothetical protein VEA41_02810, partial [Salinarimonas sp.]|nr:hypothetical protein [Salinarimonas sp.]